MKLQVMIRVLLIVMMAAAIESRSVRPQDQNTQFVKKQQFLERSGPKILPAVQTRLVPLEIAIRHVPSFRRRYSPNIQRNKPRPGSTNPKSRYTEEFDNELLGK
jgi:hypothetical protein